MVPVLSLFIVLSAVASSGAEESCVGPSCQHLDDELSHLLQFRSTETKEQSLVSQLGSCDTLTGGTCSWLACDSSRNAVCDRDGKCACSTGLCHDGNGKCVCSLAAHVTCPGSGNMCSGDQCCPGTADTNGKTFPCPSASAGFTNCGQPAKVTDCLR